MAGFNQFNDVFTNNDADVLDMMARNINNQKKTIYKEAKNNKSLFEKEIVRGIDAYYGNTGLNFSQTNNNYNGDFVSSLPTPLDEQSKQSISSLSSKNTNKTSSIEITSDKSTLLSINEMSDSDLSSGYSSLPSQKKKYLCSNNNHLKKYYEKDDGAINHIHKCTECKQQLLTLLKENHHDNNDNNDNSDNNNDSITDNNIVDNNPLSFIVNNKEVKNIFISIIIGIIVIICCDIYFSK